MCSAQAENRLELSDSLLLAHYCWGLHPGAPTPSQCASISPCEPQFKRAQSALKVCMGSGCACPDWVDARDLLQRRSVTLTSAYYPDRLVPTLAGCALQSPRYGLLYCHFLEGRKAGRKEERKEEWLACAKVLLFTSTSSDTPQRTRILFHPAHMRFQSMHVAF